MIDEYFNVFADFPNALVLAIPMLAFSALFKTLYSNNIGCVLIEIESAEQTMTTLNYILYAEIVPQL